MEGATSTEFIQEYLRLFSELSNITHSGPQRENLINTILLLIANQFNFTGCYVEISQGHASTSQNHSFLFGINYEVLGTLFSSTKLSKDYLIDDRFQIRLYNIVIDETESIYSIQEFRSASIFELEFQGELMVKIYIIGNENYEDNENLLSILQALSRLLSNTYYTLDQLNQIRQSTELEREIFRENQLPMVLLHRDYKINRINHVARNLFPAEASMDDDFFSMILTPQDYQLVVQDIQQTPIGISLEIKNKLLTLPDLSDTQRRYNIKIRKLDVKHSFQILILLEQVAKSDTDAIKSELNNPRKSLLNELNSYGRLYLSSPPEALKYGKSNFFPGGFVFTINEQSGPLVLSSSPEMDHDIVFEEAIKLVAGLNTNQIISQGYINGSTPWTYPEGELRWIAFAIPNEEARGDIEIHVIGIVVKENLLMIRSDMNNTLFGLLLGAMNNYMELISNDMADFVTEDFQFDTYFSTLTLIERILIELRTGAAEVLAAISTDHIK